MSTAKMVLLDGFTQEEAVAAMRAVKAASGDPDAIAFAVTTPTNAEWTVKELIAHVTAEHAHMRSNPPKG